MIDYYRFGDVLIFDSTYKINIYQKPMVILSGVNNHFQTTVFACGILDDETAGTYTWVLTTFLEAMNYKHPVSVITDGDLAMRNAIKEVIPHAQHRLCAWHLCRNAEGTMKKGADFMQDFGKCLKKKMSEADWIENWQLMVDKWRIHNRRWTHGAYMSRENWAEAYLKDKFFAGMTTTSRCESINKFFKEFVNSKNNLTNLCQGVMRGLEKLRDNERSEHAVADQTEPVLTSDFKVLEEHAAKVYTRNVYKMFREQARRAEQYNNTQIMPLDNVGADEYRVERLPPGKSVHMVSCNRDNSMIKCTCKKYESSNMICRHMIYVLHLKGVGQIPEILIVERWRKTDRVWYENEPTMREPKQRQCDDKKLMEFRRGLMKSRMEQMTDLGCTSQETFNVWEETVSFGIRRLKETITSRVPVEGTTTGDNQSYANVRPPRPMDTRSKGSAKNTQKKCGRCKQLGHNRVTCTNPPPEFASDHNGSQSQASHTVLDDTMDYNWSQDSAGMGTNLGL